MWITSKNIGDARFGLNARAKPLQSLVGGEGIEPPTSAV
jgi:hypothetical protein